MLIKVQDDGLKCLVLTTIQKSSVYGQTGIKKPENNLIFKLKNDSNDWLIIIIIIDADSFNSPIITNQSLHL